MMPLGNKTKQITTFFLNKLHTQPHLDILYYSICSFNWLVSPSHHLAERFPSLQHLLVHPSVSQGPDPTLFPQMPLSAVRQAELHSDLKIQEKDELQWKKLKAEGLDENGEKEAQLRRNFNGDTPSLLLAVLSLCVPLAKLRKIKSSMVLAHKWHSEV